MEKQTGKSIAHPKRNENKRKQFCPTEKM